MSNVNTTPIHRVAFIAVQGSKSNSVVKTVHDEHGGLVLAMEVAECDNYSWACSIAQSLTVSENLSR